MSCQSKLLQELNTNILYYIEILYRNDGKRFTAINAVWFNFTVLYRKVTFPERRFPEESALSSWPSRHDD